MPVIAMIPVVRYLGKKWQPDFNCWDLVRLIYKQEFAIELCPHGINRANSIRQANSEIAKELPEWCEVETPIEGDVILLGKKSLSWHVGFMLTENLAIHLIDNAASKVQPISEIRKGFHTSKFYRHENIHLRQKSVAPPEGI